ncbi:MAG: NYN domain-containing protein [Halieaceae bacterium]|nr:NYN domain-containing protein [Halieaceae bacterium]
MTKKEQSQSLAVLIDADNTSARYAQAIFEEIAILGEANVRRIYGDFSSGRLAGWDKEVQSLAILQQQQRNNTTGKNAADIALVIDAMDLMHKGMLDGFCLISSDSDFTRLAQRLREDGMVVYGFGERKTPEAFRSACNRFIYVDNLVKAGVEKGSGKTAAAAPSTKKEAPSKSVSIIVRAIEESDDDGWANLGVIGTRILGTLPDFDPRTYGCPNLSTLVSKSGGFDIRKEPGSAVYIRRKVSAGKAAGKSAGGKA